MHRRRAVVVVLSLVAPVVPSLAAPPAGAASWVVDRVRFEPVDDPTAGTDVLGVGSYRGAIEVVRSTGGLGVVNDLHLEDYLKGISEVPVSWPAEAQRAQAIAARTFALNQMQRTDATPHRAVGAHLCATDSCQVYRGLEKERREGADAWVAAVEATAGQAILNRSQPILAKYSSSNGGRSVAGGHAYLRAVDDKDDAASPLHRWSTAIPLSSLARLFPLPGPLRSAAWSGDAVVLAWADESEDQGQASVAVEEFRARVNAGVPAADGLPVALPSAQFSVSTPDGADHATFDGRGWGHGVGMSQYGALGKARRGLKAPEILAAYYGGLRPARLAPDQAEVSVRVAVAMDHGAVTV
ncbi:MAG: SpoIID/LytB domain-containing protein, partial [Acidimicrobiales bacterium]